MLETQQAIELQHVGVYARCYLMLVLHYKSWLFLEGFYFPTALCLPLFAVSAVHADCSSKFCKPKSSVFCLYNRQLNCKNSAQNALEVDILKSKVKTIFWGRGNDLSPVGRGHSSPHLIPWTCGARPCTLFANPGSATEHEINNL